MSEEVKSIPIEGVKRPTDEILKNLLPEINDYLLWLEKRSQLMSEELEARTSPQALGICWFDLFGGVTAPDGSRHEVKFNLTQRSNVDSLHAFKLALSAAQQIKGEFHMTPYVQSMIPASRKKTSGNGDQEQSPPAEDKPTGRTRGSGRTRSAETQTKEPIGAEVWLEVAALEVFLSLDKSQKYLRVKCGQWQKHGIPAYLDSSNIPEDIVAMVNEGNWTVEQPSVKGNELKTEFRDMQWVLIEPTAEKVQALGFAEKEPA